MARVATAVESLGFDCAAKLTDERVKKAYEAGYRFVVRYVGLGPNPHPGDLDRKELDLILDAGLALMVVQHVRYPGWHPNKSLGRQDGATAALFARMAGYADGAQLWLDAEGMASKTTLQDAVDYVEAWTAVVKSTHAPGIYVGYGTPFTAADLWRLTVDRYWSDYGPRKVEKRGFCIKQMIGNLPAFGIRIDPDWLKPDDLGGLPKWMVK